MGNAVDGFSTSARWERRTFQEAAGRAAHEARTAEHPGDAHSNRMIDPERTHFNEVWVNDGNGGIQRCRAPKEWIDYARQRLADVKGPIVRKPGPLLFDDDGKPVMVKRGGKQVQKRGPGEIVFDENGEPKRKHRPDNGTDIIDFVLMLDPDFTGESVDLLRPENNVQRENVRKLLLAMVGVTQAKFGAENMVGFSIQWDETHPHVHMWTLPITDEDVCNLKAFVDGPAQCSAFHDEYRTKLRGVGYNATMERIDGGRSHQKTETYKREQEKRKAVEEAAEKLAAERAEVARLQQELAEREQELNETMKVVAEARRVAEGERERLEAELDKVRETREAFAAQTANDREKLAALVAWADDFARKNPDAAEAMRRARRLATTRDLVQRYATTPQVPADGFSHEKD